MIALIEITKLQDKPLRCFNRLRARTFLRYYGEASDDDDEIVDSDEDDWDRESAGEWTRIPSDHDIPCGSGGGGNDDLSLDDGSGNGLSFASDGQLSAVQPIEGGGMDAAALKKLIADHARFQVKTPWNLKP